MKKCKNKIWLVTILMLLIVWNMGILVQAEENGQNTYGNKNEKETVTTEETSGNEESDVLQKIGEESEETLNKDAMEYNKILQILVVYKDKEEVVHPIQGGSGFLIGDESDGSKYLITANEVVEISDETKKAACEVYGIEEEDFKTELQIVVKRDVVISANMVTNSTDMNFAVLELSQNLYDRKPFVLCDDDKSMYKGKRVTVVGFPIACELGNDVVYYTSRDVNIISGTALGESKLHEEKYLHHNVVPSEGNLGGVILNEKGDVLALNQSTNDEDGYYGLEIDAIMPVLKALGIDYKTSSQVAAEEQAILDAIVHKEELENNIKVAYSFDEKNYTKKTMKLLTPVLNKAQKVYDDKNATQEQVDAINNELLQIIPMMKHKIPLWIILSLISVVSVITIIVFTIYMVKTKTKRQEKKKRRQEEMNVTEPSPVFQENANGKDNSYQRIVQQSISQSCESPVWNQVQTRQPNASIQQYAVPPIYPDQGTQVLTAVKPKEEQDITQIPRNIATLIRCSTGEHIMLYKPNYMIGKDKERVDYCVSNNSAVSRVHAMFIRMNEQYYIVDKKATNKTAINGKVLVPEQQYLLHNQDHILMANEEFIINMRAGA